MPLPCFSCFVALFFRLLFPVLSFGPAHVSACTVGAYLRETWNVWSCVSQLECERVKERERGHRVLNLAHFCRVSGGKPEWNYLPLQYHQSDSAPAYCSFLFIPIALLSPFRINRCLLFLGSAVRGQGIRPEVPHVSVVFYSPGLLARTPSPMFSPHVLCVVDGPLQSP